MLMSIKIFKKQWALSPLCACLFMDTGFGIISVNFSGR